MQPTSNIRINTNAIATDVVKKADYTPAFSILVQQSGTGTPESLSVSNSTILGRQSGGGSEIEDLSPTDAKTILSLENVDNTSDANKPVSIAQQTALDAKLNLSGGTMTGAILGDQSIRGYRPIGGEIDSSADLSTLTQNTYNTITSALSAITITVSDAANALYSIGWEIEFFVSAYTNTIDFAVSGSQAIVSKGSQLQLTELGVACVLKKVANNTWHLIGAQ